MKPKLRSDAVYFKMVVEKINSLPKNKNYKLLDIGAGKKYLKEFLPKNVIYQSLDYGPGQDYNFNLDNGKMPLKSGTYDLIVCLETLEHTLYPRRVLKEILRIASNDALFFFSLPNEYNFYCRFNFLIGKKTEIQETFATTEKNLHIHYPRVKDALNLFSEFIKIQKIDYNWYSRTGFYSKGIKGILSKSSENLFNYFAKVKPSLFTRNVIVYGTRKE